jgi:PAS domain S-box-containing protein
MSSDVRKKGKPARGTGVRRARSSKAKSKRGVSPGFTASFSIQPGGMNLTKMLEALKPHDHLCLIYESKEEWRAAVVPFISTGLKNGEKCIYIVDDSTAAGIRKYLGDNGVDVAAAEKSGQLSILNETETYTREGSFDPDKMIGLLISEAEKAIAEDYSTLRVTGEMTWVLRGHSGSEKILEYEARLNSDLFPKYPCLAICQYDRRKLDPEIIKGVIMTHPLLVFGDRAYRNFYYIEPEEFLNEKRTAREVQQWLNNIEREQQIEEKYWTVLEDMEEGYYEVDLAGNWTFFNDTFCNSLGYSKEELTGVNYRAVTFEEDADTVFKIFEEAYRTGEIAKDFSFRAVCKDGSIRLIEASAFPVRNEDGNIIGFRGIGRDITEQKKAEEALRESEERYRFLVELSPEAIFVSSGGKHVFANSAAVKLLGASGPDQIVGKPVTDFVHPDYREIVTERMRKAMETGIAPTIIEEKFIRFDGTVIDVEVRAVPLVYQGNPAMQAVVCDITERKQMEEILIDEAARRRILFDNARDGIVVLDEDAKVVEANRRFVEMLGYTLEEVRELHTWDWDIQWTREELLEKGRSVDEAGVLLETCHRRKDGTVYDVEISVNSAMIAGQKLIFCVCRDVTERKKTEEAIRHFNLVLRAIRNVNQLIARGVDRDTLIKGVCENFVKTRGFYNAWIALLDESGKLVTAAEAGLGNSFLQMIERLKRGEFPDCGRKALAKSGVVVFEDPPSICTDCPVAKNYSGRGGMSIRLEYGGKVYGMMTVSTPLDFLGQKDEGGLFEEVAGDIAFALHSMEQEEERDRAEEALRDSEERYRRLIETAYEGVWIVDDDGRTTFVNARMAEMLGYNADDMMNKSLFLFMDEEWKVVAEEKLERSRLGVVEQYEFKFRRKDGSELWTTIAASPVSDRDGRYVGSLRMVTDITEHKRADQALAEEATRRRMLMENSMVGISVLDENCKLVDANKRFADMLGYSPEEALELYVWDWDDHYTPEEIREMVRTVDETGQHFETRHRRKDGTVFDVELSNTAIVVAGKKLVFCVSSDITERKEAEEALHRSEQNFRDSIENSPLGIRVLGKSGKSLYANRALLDLWGYSSLEELEAVPREQRYTPASYADYLERSEKRKRGEPVPYNYETSIVRSDGEVRILSASRGELLWNGENHFQIVYQDITERKRIEEELRTSHDYLDRLLNSMVEVLMVVDTNYNIIEVNRSFLKHYGRGRKDVIGRKCYETLHMLSEPCSEEQRRCPLRAVLKTGKPFYAEQVHETVGGQDFIFEVSMFPIMDSAGNIEALVEMQHDITEGKRVEEERRQLEQKAQLASRLASVGEMAAGIAHEINNPLTSVIGYSQLLSDRDDIPEDALQDLKAIDEGAQRVAGIVKRLLTFARQTKPERTLTNINELITNTLDLRAYHLRTNNIKVITELATDLPITTADPAQLQQVFLNIIVNAETAMKLARGKGKLLIKTEEVDGNIRISFKDNGSGIPKENLVRIFDPFFTTREVGQGTGLGLSICHGIIAQHKGRLWAESEAGKGATFIAELPVIVESERLEIVEPAGEEPQKMPKARILVVDDEPSTLEFLNRLLTSEGHEVDTVSNAAEAFEMVKNKRYSLILLDIKMPGVSGIELYGRMQKIAQSFADRVIFITGDVMGTDTEAFLSKTKVSYVAKPFDVNQLKRKIELFLTGGQE